MSDINTILSNYNKKLSDSHTSLKTEIEKSLASSGGSEWKFYKTLYANESSELPAQFNEIMVIMHFNSDTNDIYQGIISKNYIEKVKTNYSKKFYFSLGTTLNYYNAVEFSDNTIIPVYCNSGEIFSNNVVYTDIYYR